MNIAPTIRPLQPEDWERLRDLRLHGLRTDPGMFFASYAEDAKRQPDDWRGLLTKPAQRIFGVFALDELVGITAVFPDRDDPTGSTAVLGMSYVLPDYRGRGLSRLLYETRLAWIRSQRQFNRVKVSHRASNVASRHAIRRAGFTMVGRKARIWPDGEMDDEVLYEMDLDRDVSID